MEHEPDDDRPLLRSTRLPPATDAVPRPSLEDSTARARGLREALDELRAELDGTTARTRRVPVADAVTGSPPASLGESRTDAGTASPGADAVRSAPEPPVEPDLTSGGPGRPAGPSLEADQGRRDAVTAVGVVLALAAVVLAGVGIARIVAWSVNAPPRSEAVGTPSLPAPAPATAGTSPGTDPSLSPSGGAPAGPPVALPDGLPASGPGADLPGADAFAAVRAGGDVDVWERLVVRPGTTAVSLQPAPATSVPRGTRADLVDVEIAVDGLRVTAGEGGTGWQVRRPDGAAFTHVVVRYRLTGALVRAAPAPPGRVTLVLRPVTGPTAVSAGDPVVVRLTDPRVGAVYCPAAKAPLCAVSQGDTHVATVPDGASPVVLAQLTLR